MVADDDDDDDCVTFNFYIELVWSRYNCDDDDGATAAADAGTVLTANNDDNISV